MNRDVRPVKVRYGSVWAYPIRERKKSDHVYARVIGRTIYFLSSKEKMLRKKKGKYRFEKLMRHELEHIYQSERDRFFVLKYWFKFFLILLRTASPYRAYHENPYEIEAREAALKGLTKSEMSIFERDATA